MTERQVVRNLKSGTQTLALCKGKNRFGKECNHVANASGYCRHHKPGEYIPVADRDYKNVSAHEFIRKYAMTLDPHDRKTPVKNFPNHPYIHHIIDQWLENELVLVPKSRQMLCSWLFVALHLWDVLTNEGRTVFFISKKEEDAGFGNDLSLLSRAKFILDHLPTKMKKKYRSSARPPSIQFPDRYSSILACSQDAEALRQYTASRILSDEMAFQERAEKAYTAMKPTIDGGGALTGISTPNGRHNLFYLLVHDIKKGERKEGEVGVRKGKAYVANQKTLCNGLTVRKNRNGFAVLSLHRSANPQRGDDWAKKMKPTYHSEDAWKQEQELDFTKAEGTRVYPGFRLDRHVTKLKYNPWRTIWRGWDFGYNHPACVWVQMDEYDRVNVLKEFMGEEVIANVFAREVQHLSDKWFPGCSFKDAGDPAGRFKSDKSERSTIDILRGLGIKVHMSPQSVKDGINCLRGLLVPRGDDRSSIVFDPECEILIDGMLGGYLRNDKDEPVKDGYFEHLMDALRYFINVNYDVRTYRPFRQKGIFIPKRTIIDPTTGF